MIFPFGKWIKEQGFDELIYDFKNFDSPKNIDNKVFTYGTSAGSRSSAQGVVFNLQGNEATVNKVNEGLRGIRDMITNTEDIPEGMAERVGLIYSDGKVKFLAKTEIFNGANF